MPLIDNPDNLIYDKLLNNIKDSKHIIQALFVFDSKGVFINSYNGLMLCVVSLPVFMGTAFFGPVFMGNPQKKGREPIKTRAWPLGQKKAGKKKLWN